MAEQNVNPVALLGRLLTFLGVVWFGIIVLGGIGLLSELGMSGDFLAGIGGSIIPALILVAAGRALRRRAKATEGQNVPVPVTSEPTVREKRVPTSRSETSTPIPTPPRLPEPGPTSSPPVPRQIEPLPPPSTKPVPEPKSPTPEPETSPSIAAQVGPIKKVGPAKTSKEMVEEAHKRWGRGRTG